MQRTASVTYKSLIFLFFITFAHSAMAQNYAGHNWYFGNDPFGIRFNRSDNSASLVNNKVTPFGTGGSSVASDPVNGNLLFYTDGETIYDATHAVMPNGTLLGANTSANQPVAITKVPGQKSQYYVFVNTANAAVGGTVSFRIVDMSLFGNALFPTPPLGAGISVANTAVAGLTGRSEAMIIVPHSNGEDFWLITHANGTPDYTVTSIDRFGVGTTSQTTFPGVGLIEVAANFAYHPSTRRIAVSPQEDTRDIEIIDFNNSNGVITPNQRILNTGIPSTTTQAIYDIEWSNNGQYLYISRHGEPGITADVVQYDILNPATTLTSVLPQAIFRSYGLQMAPDSAIYHLYQSVAAGPFLLGTITNTDTIASQVVYDPTAFASNPNFINATQFSSFPPPDTVMLNVSFTSQGTCANSPVSFFPTVSPGADSLVWTFGDGSGANAWSPVHTYTAAGTFNVHVRAFLKGDTAGFTLPVNITQFDLQLQLVQDTTACLCEYKPPVGSSCNGGPFQVTVQAQNGSPQFQWFGPSGPLLGQTTATLTPDSAGYYYVVGTIGTCSAYAGVNIKTYDSLDQRANIWYFGQNAGIDFNPLPDDPAVGITGPLDTHQGCSVISDRNGQVIFSTDGLHIYDKTDADITPTPVPPGLGGESDAAQSALIISVPGDETLFYIFTTQVVHGSGRYELRYSLFDLKLNNGVGGLVEFNQLLFTKSTERITSNGNWLIAHEYGNNSFRAYPISQQGIGNPIISAVGSDHLLSIEEHGRGYMELGAQSSLAVALSTPGVSNVVEVFDFVDSTGTVTNFRTADLKSTTGQVYGLEISPAGNKLYATLLDANSEIVEFAFDSLGLPYFKNRITQTGQRLGAMQIGPDGQIYVAIDGSTTLGTFQANEDTTAVTNLPVPLQPFSLAAGTQSYLGLPNFTQIITNPPQAPGFTFMGVCVGDSTTFTATGKDPAIDKFDWFFGDGQAMADGGVEIKHLYAAPGTYTASVRIYNKCEVIGTFTQDVVINALPPDPSGSAVLCTGSVTLDANPQNLPNFSFAWSTGDTTRTLVVNEQAFYTVAITDANGCVRDGTFLAVDNRPQVDFGPDQTICQNTPLFPLDAQNPGATYLWELNDAPNGNTSQTQSVDTSAPGIFEYKVRVTDIGTPFMCFTDDSVRYTINESPAFTASATNPSACGVADAQVTTNITAPATSLFTFSITGTTPVNPNPIFDQSVGAIVTPNLAAGTYGITVSDQVSGCFTINTVSINDLAFTVGATQNGACDPTIVIDVTTTPNVATPVTFRVIDNASGVPIPGASGTGNSPSGTFSTLPVPSGSSYVVEVRQTSTGCIASLVPPLTITQGATLPVTFNTANICTNGQLTAISAGATSFDWAASPTGSVSPQTGATVTVNPGTWNLQVSADDGAGGSCPGIGTITLTVDSPTTPDFTQSDACSDQVTLTATPSGTYTYRWTRTLPAPATPILGGQQLIVGTSEDNSTYQMQVVNTVSGCVFNSPAHIVSVAGDLQITLTSTTPCEGSPFTLTAGSNLTPVTFAWSLDGNAIAGQTASTLTETRDGLYEVAVTRGACVETSPFNIVLAPVTPGLLTDIGIICPDPANPDPNTREVLLDPGDSFISYQWFKEGVALAGETDPTYRATEVGLYSVDLINPFGCASSDKTELFEECNPRIAGPNAFRPGSNVSGGGDFTNRDFKLFTFFIADEDFHIFIFNRWGEMIYESPERDFRWNGGYNNNTGQPLPPGTYSYVVKYKSSYRPEEGVQEKRGGVVLLR